MNHENLKLNIAVAKCKPKKTMAVLRAAILFFGFMS
jgi:hypothetical protein